VNDKGNAVIGTQYGRLNGMFGANEMSICKQDLILQEELNWETPINVREAASHIKNHLLSHDPELWHRLLHRTPFSLHLHLLLENFDLHEHLKNP
jgi:dolichol kinase